ncbi:MAG TPA: M20/M25/M40 family metallo-hydrolase [Anaerolineaceae bacterium]|nr:M20/M25/M40 family metallo-hydrolase [Anaerolineaceae bacterium]
MSPLPGDPSIQRILDLACEIQKIPAPTSEEMKRAEFLASIFQEEGLADVEIDAMGNVLARFIGMDFGRRPVLVTAHLDTVFPRETPLGLIRTPDRISGPGIGDNSLSLACLIGLVWRYREEGFLPAGDLWLIGTTGEEGLGDLKGIRAIVDRFEGQHEASPLAYLVLEGMGLGEIFYRGLGVRRYRVSCHTQGGHSWIDFGRPSAIHELARFINCLAEIPLPDKPKTILNVGIIQGGISINTIAPYAWCEIDLRSENPKSLVKLIDRVENLVHDFNHPDSGVRLEAEIIGNRPAGEIPANHPLVKLAKRCLRGLGIQPIPGIGSTDANIPLSRGLSAICIGMTRGTGAHTLQESIFTPPLSLGMEQLFQIVTETWNTLEKN